MRGQGRQVGRHSLVDRLELHIVVKDSLAANAVCASLDRSEADVPTVALSTATQDPSCIAHCFPSDSSRFVGRTE